MKGSTILLLLGAAYLYHQWQQQQQPAAVPCTQQNDPRGDNPNCIPQVPYSMTGNVVQGPWQQGPIIYN